MRTLFIALLSTLAVSCEMATMKWGYMYNPEKVLLMAYEAVETGNIGLWHEASTLFPYCKYGNKEGLAFLRKELKGSQFSGVKHVGTKSKGIKGKGDIIFAPHYNKSYQARLVDLNQREKALVKIRCHFELPTKVAERDPYNTDEFSRAYCVIEGIKIHGKSFTGSEVCDDLQ